MRNYNPDIIKTLREEEFLGKLHCHNFEEKQKPATEEYKNENLSSAGKKIQRN